MSIMSIVGVLAGVFVAFVLLCVIIITMCPPKEYRGDGKLSQDSEGEKA